MKQAELEEHKRLKIEHVKMLKDKSRIIDAKIDRVQNEIAEKKREINQVKRESRERDNEREANKTDHPIRDYATYFWNAYLTPLWETVYSM